MNLDCLGRSRTTSNKLVNFGVMMKGVRIHKGVSNSDMKKIRKALKHYGIVLFQKQKLDTCLDMLADFMRNFGELEKPLRRDNPGWGEHREVVAYSSIPGQVKQIEYYESNFHRVWGHTAYPSAYVGIYVNQTREGHKIVFCRTDKVCRNISNHLREKWGRLHLLFDDVAHPVVFRHPTRDEELISTNFAHASSKFQWDRGTMNENIATGIEAEIIHREIMDELEKYVYTHQVKEGDFFLCDNLIIARKEDPMTAVETEDLIHFYRVVVRNPADPHPQPRDEDEEDEQYV